MNTKPIIQIDIALILLGIATLTYQGNSYAGYASLFETNKPTPGNDRIISLTPLAGVLLLGGGSMLVALGVRKSARRR